MIKRSGLLLTLVLLASMAEVGEAAQVAGKHTLWSLDTQSSPLKTDDEPVFSYEADTWETYRLRVTVLIKQDAKQTEADQLFNEAIELWQISQWQDALKKFEQALILYREIGDRQGEGRALIGFSVMTSKLGQYSQALGYLEQALVISRETRVKLEILLEKVRRDFD